MQTPIVKIDRISIIINDGKCKKVAWLWTYILANNNVRANFVKTYDNNHLVNINIINKLFKNFYKRRIKNVIQYYFKLGV